MYTEFDYLSASILNNIEQRLEALYQKNSNYTSETYTAKVWQEGELVYVDEISDIETALEYLGDGFGYPDEWITSRNWNESVSNNISYKDINRILNNIEILEKHNYNPLLPKDTLYPSETLYPRNGLPTGYTQVDYIESNGNQYIDMGLKGTNNTSIVIRYKLTSSTSVMHLLGNIVDSTKSISFNIGTSSGSKSRWGNDSITRSANIATGYLYSTTISKNGYYVSASLWWTPTQNTFTTPSNMYLFTANGASNRFKGKLYSCKIHENGLMIRNFIPCYRNSDGEVGLYDMVNNVFYTNIGTGKFTYGEE